MNIQFSDLIENSPSAPGIYKMYGADGTLLYVGKAKNLSNRLKQYVDISNVLKQIKRAFAKELFKQMQTYFRKINMPLKLVDTIVVSGGGSMQSQYIDANNETQVTSEPVSYYLAQELQKLSEATRVEYYGDTPRFANISGLYIKALVAESKMAKPVTQPVVQPMNQTIGASQTVVPNADTGMGMGFPVNPVM